MSMLVLWLSLCALCALRDESEPGLDISLIGVLIGMIAMFVRLAT